MRFDGEWYLCDDRILRPVIRGEVLAHDGSWVPTFFLLDTGADRTVLSGAVYSLLGLPFSSTESLGGVGGTVESVILDTQLRFTRENGGKVLFHGNFAAFTDLETVDMSVLGRNLTGLFAAIVDQPGNQVCSIGHGHHYKIEQS